eukprot:928-Heterococcus_DN1.PRE.1
MASPPAQVLKAETALAPIRITVVSATVVINLGNISGVIPNVRWEFKQRIIEDGGTLTSSFTGMALVIELNTKALPLNVKRSSSNSTSATSTSSVSSNSSKEEHKQSFISRIKAGLSSGSSSSQSDATTAAHSDDIEAELFGFKPQSITLTKCECHVGSVRIAVSSSKHDALYNMMASHLEQILKAEIAHTIATTIKEEFNAVLSKLNDRVAEQWHNLQMKTCQRLICTVVRAK